MQSFFQAAWTYAELKRVVDFSIDSSSLVNVKIFDHVFLSPHLTLFLTLIHLEMLSLCRSDLLGQILSPPFFPPKHVPTK